MKTIVLVTGLVFCLTLVGCGRIHGPVEQVKALADEKESVITQMGKKLEATPTEAGVDEARKIFEGKKDSLKAKNEAIKAAPQGFNADWRSLKMSLDARHSEMLGAIGAKLRIACSSEPCSTKWNALEKDFKDAVN